MSEGDVDAGASAAGKVRIGWRDCGCSGAAAAAGCRKFLSQDEDACMKTDIDIYEYR